MLTRVIELAVRQRAIPSVHIYETLQNKSQYRALARRSCVYSTTRKSGINIRTYRRYTRIVP